MLSEDLPEEAVAYDAGWVAERLAAHGLEPTESRPGTWSGREDGLSFQDSWWRAMGMEGRHA